jgi:ABC-2 type transport system ATP-binding protein
VDFEARDVEQLIDWVSTQPHVQLDATRDPRMGMIGGSYGGGIQLVTAAIDCRVDALVPIIAWHSLTTSLFKADTPKTGWAGLLTLASAGHSLDAHVASSNASSKATGTISADDAAWFASRGPGDLINKIAVPTLFVQGTVDTLFTLDEAVTNYKALEANDVPTAMSWFCGGHGICLTKAGDTTRTGQQAIAWLDKYVKGDSSADIGPGFELVDQDGVAYSADSYTDATGTPITATGSGVLKLIATGGAGPSTASASSDDLLGAAVLPITPALATNAVNVAVPFPKTGADSLLVGAPSLTITYSGTAAAGARPTRVFAQLVDSSTGLVVGNQITPIDVTLDGKSHTATVPLEMISFSAHAGSSVTLQIVATTVAYAQPRLGGSVKFSSISLSLPVATGLSKLSD